MKTVARLAQLAQKLARSALMQPHVPGELRDCRKDSNEAARKKLKPPPVKESPIVEWLTGAAVKQAIAKA